jgi:tRNA threonylcarbamoyladenosine biosynthesis protein TsaE
VDDTRVLASELAALARPGDLILLAGDLGAGKTSFVQGFGRALGVEEPITSPTFVLVRTYEGLMPVTHVDVYRLEHLQELVDLGIAELLDQGGVTLIEWGDAVVAALPSDFLEIRLELGDGDDERLLRLRPVGTWSARLPTLRSALDRWVAEA